MHLHASTYIYIYICIATHYVHIELCEIALQANRRGVGLVCEYNNNTHNTTTTANNNKI